MLYRLEFHQPSRMCFVRWMRLVRVRDQLPDGFHDGAAGTAKKKGKREDNGS